MAAKKAVPRRSERSHLTIEDRAKIEYGLNQGTSVRQIAKDLSKNPTTILREIERNSSELKSKKNNCLRRKNCDVKHACITNTTCNKTCRIACGDRCFKHCPDYEKGYCDKLCEPPHVCNGCSHFKVKNCMYDMIYYKAAEANKKAYSNLHDSRSGFDLTDEEIEALDKRITPMIKNGQSPYHVSKVIAPEFGISESTLRRLIKEGALTVRDIDLRDAVKRRPRNSSRRKMKDETVRLAKVGHMWGDYLKYMEENDDTTVQMDCVEGIKTDKATLLTLHWPDYRMQLAFIMDAHDAANVVATLDKIERALGTELFRETFPVILTDNGHEFTDIDGMERSCLNPGETRTRIFFCEPNRSDEKGACENNHKLIRDVIPKGTSLEPYNQADITLMMNHINSYLRKKQHGKCAYDVAMSWMPEDFFILLGLEKIPAEDVCLSPKLFSRREDA